MGPLRPLQHLRYGRHASVRTRGSDSSVARVLTDPRLESLHFASPSGSFAVYAPPRDSGGCTRHKNPSWYVLRDQGACADDRLRADGDAVDDGPAYAQVHPLRNATGTPDVHPRSEGIKIPNCRVVTDHCTTVDENVATETDSRASRAFLGWLGGRLAEAVNVAERTLVDFERGARRPYDRTLADIKSALEAAGIEFTDDDAPGVRLRRAQRRHRCEQRPRAQLRVGERRLPRERERVSRPRRPP